MGGRTIHSHTSQAPPPLDGHQSGHMVVVLLTLACTARPSQYIHIYLLYRLTYVASRRDIPILSHVYLKKKKDKELGSGFPTPLPISLWLYVIVPLRVSAACHRMWRECCSLEPPHKPSPQIKISIKRKSHGLSHGNLGCVDKANNSITKSPGIFCLILEWSPTHSV